MTITRAGLEKNVRLEGNCRQKSKRAISTIGCEPRQRFVAPALRSLSIAVAAQQQQGKRIRVKRVWGETFKILENINENV